MWTIGVSVAAAIFGVSLYFTYTRLIPERYRDYVKGIKTNGLAAVIFFAPDAITLLSLVDSFGLVDFVPSERQVIVTKVIAVTVAALRYVTSFEQKE